MDTIVHKLSAFRLKIEESLRYDGHFILQADAVRLRKVSNQSVIVVRRDSLFVSLVYSLWPCVWAWSPNRVTLLNGHPRDITDDVMPAAHLATASRAAYTMHIPVAKALIGNAQLHALVERLRKDHQTQFNPFIFSPDDKNLLRSSKSNSL